MAILNNSNKLELCPFCKSANIDPEGWASIERSGPACDDCAGTADTVELWNRRPQLEEAIGYVDRAIASYVGDPADNQFQKGYLAALEVVRAEAFSSDGAVNATDEIATFKSQVEELRKALETARKAIWSGGDTVSAMITIDRALSPSSQSGNTP